MLPRPLATSRAGPPAPRRSSVARLVFLRGRDADGCLRELTAARAALRPVLGALAIALLDRRLHEELGFRSVGDWSRERLGVGARTVREWARVWRRLCELPLLREAVLAGEVSWAVARLVVGVATKETEAACLESVRGRTVRAVEAMVRAVREAEGKEPEASDEERVAVRLPCSREESTLWQAAVELARRVAGESLPVWACAEAISAELPGAGVGEALEADSSPARPRRRTAGDEHGLREEAFPLPWRARGGSAPAEVAALARGLCDCSARAIDERFRSVIAFQQQLDFEIGRVLRQVKTRGLHHELGFPSFDRFVSERLDLSPSTARRLAKVAHAEHRAPAVANAFHRGRLTAFQASAAASVATPESAAAWVERAQRVTLRRLEDDVEAESTKTRTMRTVIAFHAPPEVAALFLASVRRAGSLARLLAHAIATWVEQGDHPVVGTGRAADYADFARDGWRCTFPGCTARRGLESHHIRFRSAGGPDVAWNRTTLCHFHHHRGVHEGRVRVHGRAPGHLVYEQAVGRFRSGDVRIGEP